MRRRFLLPDPVSLELGIAATKLSPTANHGSTRSLYTSSRVPTRASARPRILRPARHADTYETRVTDMAPRVFTVVQREPDVVRACRVTQVIRCVNIVWFVALFRHSSTKIVAVCVSTPTTETVSRGGLRLSSTRRRIPIRPATTSTATITLNHTPCSYPQTLTPPCPRT